LSDLLLLAEMLLEGS